MRHVTGPSALTAVLSDGLVCDGFIYKYLWDDLARVCSVAHWNYRGHGRSGPPVDPERLAVTDHAQDLDAVRHHLGDPPVVLVGHSFGTQVLLEAYRLRREGVRGLVLLCGSFGRVTHTFKGTDLLANVLPKIIEWTRQHPRLARALWGNVPPSAALRVAQLTGDVDGARVSAGDMEPYFRHASSVDVDLFLGLLAAAGEHSAQDLLPNIDVPVLIIAGDRDSFTPPGLSEAMAEAIPHAELTMIAGGTHVAPLEHRALVDAKVSSFIEGLA